MSAHDAHAAGKSFRVAVVISPHPCTRTGSDETPRSLAMARACTIFSPTVNCVGIVSLVQELVPTNTHFVGKEDEWKQIRIQAGSGTLVITSKQRRAPGDEFSRLILGTYNFFRMIQTESVQQQQSVLNFLLSCNMALGVVAEPAFAETDERLDVVFAMTEFLGGMIFNGSAMIDRNGALVLSAEGRSEP